MHVEKHSVTIVTDASGDGTGYSDVVTGSIRAIHYVKAGSGNYADGVDFVVTNDTTGEVIWDEDNVNASASRYPRVAVHDNTGTAATLDGTRAMRDRFVAANDRIKIVVASGGDTKTGTFRIYVG